MFKNVIIEGRLIDKDGFIDIYILKKSREFALSIYRKDKN